MDVVRLDSNYTSSMRYVACLNANSRCGRLTACDAFDTSFNVVQPEGYWPGANHFEFALYYPGRYFDKGCTPSQKIYNQTSWTDAATDSPASTAAISTNQPLPIGIASARYDDASEQLVLELAANAGALVREGGPDVGLFVTPVNFQDGGVVFNGKSYAIAAGSTAQMLRLQTQAGHSAIAVKASSILIFAANFGVLDVEFNVLGSNKIGGRDYYYALSQAGIAVGGRQSGAYAVGDILQIEDGCAVPAKTTVSHVSDGKITPNGLAPYQGGVCNSKLGTRFSNPGPGPFATTCLSGLCASNAGSGAIAAHLIYQWWTTGYLLQPGLATYLGPVTLAHNRFDATGAASEKNAVFYQGTNCLGAGAYADNLDLKTGLPVKPSGQSSGRDCPS